MAGFEPWSYGVGRQQLCHLWHNICPRLENLFRSWNFFIVVNGQKLNHLFTPRLDYPYLLPTQQALTSFIKTTSFAKKDWESNCTGLLLWWHTLWSVPPRISFSLLNLISFQVKFGPNWRVSDSWGVPALPYLTFTGTNLIFKTLTENKSSFASTSVDVGTSSRIALTFVMTWAENTHLLCKRNTHCISGLFYLLDSAALIMSNRRSAITVILPLRLLEPVGVYLRWVFLLLL